METKNKFLNQFDPKIKSEIIEFGKRLTSLNADVYILMARKAACFIDCLKELNLVNLDGFITSERILDLDIKWLKGKNIAIIDDTIISGTTLYKTINKLNAAEVESITVSVLTVDKEHFVEDLLINNQTEKSYLTKPYLKLTHTECIKVCSDIVNALSIFPRPYNVDFPYLSKVNILENDFKKFVQHTNWTIEDGTSYLQDRFNTFNHSFSPNFSLKKEFDDLLGIKVSNFAMMKVRVYGRYLEKGKNSYILRILPVVVLKPLRYPDLNNLFNSIKNINNDKVFDQIETKSSKLRFIQYFLASNLAELWVNSISRFVKEKIEINHDVQTLQLLFNQDIITSFLKLMSVRSIPVLYSDTLIEPDELDIDNIDYVPTNQIDDDNVESIHLLLTEPFLRLYHEQEKNAWEIVKKHGRKVFKNPDYIRLVNRLDRGYSLSFLIKLLDFAKEINAQKIVSSFLDKAIDIGIAVPIIVDDSDNEIIYRAYRHGEDVPFGEKEEKLLAIVIKSFSDSLGRQDLQHIWLEKLTVLLLKIGIQNKFLNPIITNIPQRDTITSKHGHLTAVASIKTYLYGPVVTYKEYEIGESIETKPYLESSQKDLWLSNVLLEKGIIIKEPNKNLYRFNQFPDISLDEKLEGKAENIGLVFGELMRKKIINKENDLVKLTACVYPQDCLQSMAAEINIFNKKWRYYHQFIERNFRKKEMFYRLAEGIRNSNLAFTAVNSGQQKFSWFMEKDAIKLIDKIKNTIEPKYLKNIWAEFWSPNKDWSIESIDKDLYKGLIDQGLWLISINSYLRVLDYSLRNIAVTEGKIQTNKNNNLVGRRLDEIKEYYSKLINYKSDKRTREIIPFLKEIITKHDKLSETEHIVNIKLVLNKIRTLMYSSKILLDNSELLVNKFGKIDTIQRFSHTLYIDIDETTFFYKKSIWKEIFDFIDTYKREINSSKEEQEHLVVQLPNDKNVLERGVWFASNGLFSSNTLPILADKIIQKFSKKLKVKCVLFGQLPEGLRVKTAGMNNSNMKFGNFWTQVTLLSEVFKFDLQSKIEESELISLVEKKDFLDSEFLKLDETERYSYSLKLSQEIKDKGLFNNNFILEQYLYSNKMKTNYADIGIITVVTQETRAVLQFLKIDPKKDLKKNGRSFYEGIIESSESGLHKVALTQQLDIGNRSVIPAYNSMVNTYHPKLIILLGIAGSISKDLGLCDVVIANQVIYYENRKEVPNKTNRRGDIFKINPKLKQIINKFFIIHDEPAILNAQKDSFKDTFQVLTGPIGSGEAVIADNASEIKEWLIEVNSKTMALEMEAGGFLQAFYEDGLSENQPIYGALVIRGVSDHADTEKDDKWRKPASENAVKCLSEILKIIPEFED
jgi:nucleoside phosphorylase